MQLNVLEWCSHAAKLNWTTNPGLVRGDTRVSSKYLSVCKKEVTCTEMTLGLVQAVLTAWLKIRTMKWNHVQATFPNFLPGFCKCSLSLCRPIALLFGATNRLPTAKESEEKVNHVRIFSHPTIHTFPFYACPNEGHNEVKFRFWYKLPKLELMLEFIFKFWHASSLNEF